MKLHPKISEFRKSVGYDTVRKSRVVSGSEFDLSKREAKDKDERTLRQYFCIWGVKDDYGTMPIKGCFSKSIKERGPNTDAPYKITALYMHNLRDSVGLPVVLEEDEIGLYAEVPILKGIQVCDELVIRHKAGVCNNGSYGFEYIWDKMEYDEDADAIIMKECNLKEISFVTLGSQDVTYGVRGASLIDESLQRETEEFIKSIPQKHRLEMRGLISRYISLAQNEPPKKNLKALGNGKPKKGAIDYNFLTNNF
ncbi:MAG: hypothetical protein E6Q68_01695 [Polynucleobacter sp.]|nr:MAG: hypothetical protein E6Q68_01695 [Polynucleobacter sp.]